MEFVWGEDQAQTFQRLKKALASKTMFTLYELMKYHEVHADASKQGIIGIIFQRKEYKRSLYFIIAGYAATQRADTQSMR